MHDGNALISACAVAPKRPRRLAHAQDDLIWTDAGATGLDLEAAPNGGGGAIGPMKSPTTFCGRWRTTVGGVIGGDLVVGRLSGGGVRRASVCPSPAAPR